MVMVGRSGRNAFLTPLKHNRSVAGIILHKIRQSRYEEQEEQYGMAFR